MASTDPLPPFAYTGRKLGTAVLLFVLGVVGVITLAPFAFAVPARITLTWWDNWFDAVANVALFLPVGFLFALTRSATTRATGGAEGQAALLGFAASLCVEIMQIFEPTRFPSPTDVATNALGAATGAWLYRRASRRLGADTPLVGRLALELPLMGLVYLLVPLCTLAALTVGGTGFDGPWVPRPRAWGLAALAVLGGTLLGHIQRRHLGPARTLGARQTALIAAGWFAAGALPALATAPLVFAAGALLAAGAAWLVGRGGDGSAPINRRFEAEALAHAAPWLGAYLALVPLTAPILAPRDPGSELGMLEVLRQVESAAGFTVLGYVLAEAWGRLELRYRYTAWRVALAAGGAAAVGEAFRHMDAPTAAWLPGIAAHVLAAGYGGWIYHLQRAHVRALVAARVPAHAAPPVATSPLRRTA